MQRIIWWLRRDLRMNDNVVLHEALNDAAAVIPVFILDPVLLNSPRLAPARKQFLFESLAQLDANLQKRGSYLVVRRGTAERELLKLVRETQADAVYFHADYTPYARKRDARVMAALDGAGIRHGSFNDIYLADPDQVTKADGSPYTVFSAYRKRFESVVAIPERYHTDKKLNTPPQLKTMNLESSRGRAPSAGATNLNRGGEEAALGLARDFMARKNGLAGYRDARNDMGADATSHLSPHLHFGTVSVRELVRMARAAMENPVPRGQARRPVHNSFDGAAVWIDELVWREFFGQVLYHFPHAARRSFRSEYANLEWQDDAALLEAWAEGRTGYPLVDAGMRELQATGRMHNRARMVTASFLAKDLLLNWQLGETHFLKHLVDGDMASNNGGWQWAAGTGTDAQPYFRIFNPALQGQRFDPAGDYVRRWVPELAQVPAKYIHAPHHMPTDIARRLGWQPGQSYPNPVVDHAVQRERALQLYRRSLQGNDYNFAQ